MKIESVLKELRLVSFMKLQFFLFDIFMKKTIKVGQKLCSILVMWGNFRQLLILLLRFWRWWTTLDWEMPSLPDTLWVLITGFVSLDWNMALESMVLGLPEFAWLSRFLQPKWNFLNHLVTVINSTTNVFVCFLVLMV